MRPDFLLNFIALAPTAAALRTAFADIFSSQHAVRLARRIDGADFHRLMAKVAEAGSLEAGRREAAIHGMVNTLKGARRRQYVVEWQETTPD